MSKLLLVRHGLTDLNSAFKFAGSTDIEMSTAGQNQIEGLRNRLSSTKIDAVCTSDMKRAITSARIITAGRNLPITSFTELREMNYGQIEGMSFGEINHLFPVVAKLIEERNCQVCFPGGEGFIELEARMHEFIKQLERFNSEDTVLIVSHGGALRMLICLLLETNVDIWWHLRIDNASLSIVENQKKGAILTLLNDVSHLGTSSSIL
jgi:alpha-ribazole phosphatase